MFCKYFCRLNHLLWEVTKHMNTISGQWPMENSQLQGHLGHALLWAANTISPSPRWPWPLTLNFNATYLQCDTWPWSQGQVMLKWSMAQYPSGSPVTHLTIYHVQGHLKVRALQAVCYRQKYRDLELTLTLFLTWYEITAWECPCHPVTFQGHRVTLTPPNLKNCPQISCL